MTPGAETKSVAEAATEIGRLITRILKLAPTARLYIGIKIEPARQAAALAQEPRDA